MTDTILAALSPAPVRRWLSTLLIFALAVVFLVLAARGFAQGQEAGQGTGQRLVLALLGLASLWVASLSLRGQARSLVLTRSAVMDSEGTVLTRLDQIAASARGWPSAAPPTRPRPATWPTRSDCCWQSATRRVRAEAHRVEHGRRCPNHVCGTLGMGVLEDGQVEGGRSQSLFVKKSGPTKPLCGSVGPSEQPASSASGGMISAIGRVGRCSVENSAVPAPITVGASVAGAGWALPAQLSCETRAGRDQIVQIAFPDAGQRGGKRGGVFAHGFDHDQMLPRRNHRDYIIK